MTIYAISQQPSSWNVYRFSDNITEEAHGLSNEEEAFAEATRLAKATQPSRVIRIALNGDTRILAKFEMEVS